MIVGWDSAVNAKHCGLVLCNLEKSFNDAKLSIVEFWDGAKSIPETISDWMGQYGHILLAIDSPLGWPIKFGEVLANHQAGDSLDGCYETFFNRETDRHIFRTFKKRPLDVGANLIARTAFMTLQHLDEIRQRTQKSLSILWSSDELNTTSGMIEVYPACTLIHYKCYSTGYKKDVDKQKNIFQNLKSIYNTESKFMDDLYRNDHNFDSFICALAGADFVLGKADGPNEITSDIRQEGWTWVRSCK